MDNQYIQALRSEYNAPKLEPGDLSDNPLLAFQHWFDFTIAENIAEPNAMVLSTVTELNKPTSRVVLLKDITEQGLTFFTNYGSKKGQNLHVNSSACVNFFWQPLARQVRVEGHVEKVSEEINIAYFNSRPRLSRAGAIVSNQSEEIPSREKLDRDMEILMQLPEDSALDKPHNWGGYILIPSFFEFWQGRPGRVHDRIAFELNHGQWRKFRLSP